MTRRRLRKPCPAAQKVSYRDQAAAQQLGRRVLREYLASEASRHNVICGLWVYECRYGDHWHLTSLDQHDDSRQVTL